MLEKITKRPIKALLYFVNIALLVFALCYSSPTVTLNGLYTIITTSDGLITDYFGVGGVSATFLNSSIIGFFTLFIFDKLKIKYTGTAISSYFLMVGFAFFGKTCFNILPIFLGVYIYSKVQRENFKRYIFVALLGSSISPVVSEIAFGQFSQGTTTIRLVLISILVGCIIGFILPSISTDCMRILQGFNLYNIGFATGLIGMLFTSFLSTIGEDVPLKSIWTTGIDTVVCIFFFALFLLFILFGFLLNGKSFKGYLKIFRHSGRAVADFTILDGSAITFINMGILGISSLAFIILIDGDLNGPTLSAILTIVGFAALGKHLKNCIPPIVGVIIMSGVAHWSLKDPSIQLAALFCTALAPIAGQFGFGWGIIAGIMHSVFVTVVTDLHGGLNLYNNGFAAGLVVIILLPVIEAFSRQSD